MFQSFRNLRAEHILLENQILEPDTNLLLNLQGTTCDMIVEFEFEVAKEFGIKVLKSAKKETVIGYNVEKEEFDRWTVNQSSIHHQSKYNHGQNLLTGET